ncbi:MAG: DDE-type integrase/transposase/recombinase [Nitrososphaerota archaeon]
MICNLVRRAYLWVAREVGTGEVMAVQVSRGRGIGECLRFMEMVRDRCSNNPTVYTDRGPWYKWPIKVLRMRRRIEAFGRRNTIESWFSELKRRIRQFNACFPTYRPKVSERWIRSWMVLS